MTLNTDSAFSHRGLPSLELEEDDKAVGLPSDKAAMTVLKVAVFGDRLSAIILRRRRRALSGYYCVKLTKTTVGG